MVKAVKSKPAAKKEKKATKKSVVVKTRTPAKLKTEKKAPVAAGLIATVVDTKGKTKGKITLAKEIFGEPANKQLIAQAVRVYLANQREGGASTKTRGQVRGSTRKIYRQKGTGRARHGNIRAPIFVGGGIVFGPVPHDFSLSMPEKMKRKALFGALTSRYQEGSIIFVDGLEKLEPKTKYVAQMLEAVSATDSVLLVVSSTAGNIVRAARNIPHVDTMPASDIHTYTVLSHKHIIFMKDALEMLEKRLVHPQ
jgi:large subunit ribosomal protein L4